MNIDTARIKSVAVGKVVFSRSPNSPIFVLKPQWLQTMRNDECKGVESVAIKIDLWAWFGRKHNCNDDLS